MKSPAKGPIKEPNRELIISVRMNDREWRLIKRKSEKKHNGSVSAYLRSCGLKFNFDERVAN